MANIDLLFSSWYTRLVRSVRRRLRSADDAEDVAQEAFVRLLDEAPRDPPAWLFGVARHLAADHARSAARRERLARREAVRLVPDAAGPRADDAVLRTERVVAVRAVLARLPARDRQLLLLHHGGLSYREIAAQIGVSPSSVGSLLTRAHRRFLAECATDDRDADDIGALIG